MRGRYIVGGASVAVITGVTVLTLSMSAITTRTRRAIEGTSADNPDAVQMEIVRARGVRFDKPQPVTFRFWFPDDAAAGAVADLLQQQKMQTQVVEDASEAGYCCLALKKINISRDVLAAFRTQFEALAIARNGMYCGWVCASTK